MADDALLVDNDGEGESLCANPRHHVLGLDKVCPREVVFVGDTFRYLCIVDGGREEHHIGKSALVPKTADFSFLT